MSDALILNAAQNLQNVVTEDDFITTTLTTLKQLTQQLLEISGPFARDAFILFPPTAQMSNAVSSLRGIKLFTRDGRHTLTNIQYASPIQQYIKDDILRYIGEKIDDVCHDGTTSAMIFSASFTARLIRARKELTAYSELEIAQVFKEYCATFLNALEPYKITKEKLYGDFVSTTEGYTPEKAARDLAYMQALSSSGGNEEVAKAVAEVIEHTPESLWNYAITQKYPLCETDTAYVKAEKDTYEASYEVSFLTPQYLNHNMQKEYYMKKVDVLCIEHGLFLQSPLYNSLVQYITDSDRPLLLMVPSAQAGLDNSLAQIMQIATDNNKHVAVCAYLLPLGNRTGVLYSLEALQAKANRELLIEEIFSTKVMNDSQHHLEILKEYIIPDVEVRCNNRWIYLNNVTPVEYDENGVMLPNDTNLHPGEVSPEKYPWYTWFTQEYLPNEISKLESAFEKSPHVLQDARRAMAIATMVHGYTITVGGKEHDQQRIAHVIDDAAGAALVALKDGVYANGPLAAQLAFADMEKRGIEHDPIRRVFNDVMQGCLTDFVLAVYGPYASRLIADSVSLFWHTLYDETPTDVEKRKYWYYNLANARFKTLKSEAFSYMRADTIDTTIDPAFISSLTHCIKPCQDTTETEHNTYAPCQTARFFDVLFTRIQEVCLRFALTSYVVAPNTIWDDHYEAKKK